MKSFPIIIFLIAVVLTLSPKIYAKGLFQSLPGQVGEWQARDEDEQYNRNTLFEYINGGAELYLAYDFQQALVRRYTGPNNAEIILDIYDMGNSEDAFGIFSVERQDEDIGIVRFGPASGNTIIGATLKGKGASIIDASGCYPGPGGCPQLDDDRDGLTNEDGIDGTNNDNDSLMGFSFVDEDPSEEPNYITGMQAIYGPVIPPWASDRSADVLKMKLHTGR